MTSSASGTASAARHSSQPAWICEAGSYVPMSFTASRASEKTGRSEKKSTFRSNGQLLLPGPRWTRVCSAISPSPAFGGAPAGRIASSTAFGSKSS